MNREENIILFNLAFELRVAPRFSIDFNKAVETTTLQKKKYR